MAISHKRQELIETLSFVNNLKEGVKEAIDLEPEKKNHWVLLIDGIPTKITPMEYGAAALEPDESWLAPRSYHLSLCKELIASLSPRGYLVQCIHILDYLGEVQNQIRISLKNIEEFEKTVEQNKTFFEQFSTTTDDSVVH